MIEELCLCGPYAILSHLVSLEGGKDYEKG